MNLWYGRDFLAPILSVRQPLFETSDFRVFEFFGVWGSVGLLPSHKSKGCSTERQKRAFQCFKSDTRVSKRAF